MHDLTLAEERWLVLLFAVEDIGGAGTKADVLNWIDNQKIHIVTDDETHIVSSRESAWRNYLAWERDKLVKRGALDNKARNDWRITEAGRAYLTSLILRISDSTTFSYVNPAVIDRIMHVGLAVSSGYPWVGEVEFVEGSKTLVWTVRYERSSELRMAAINMHGCICQGCGFDFEAMYGTLGKDFIEVHHTKPVSAMQGQAVVSAETDMVVLCSNCHRMVHRRRGNPISVDDLRMAISTTNEMVAKF